MSQSFGAFNHILSDFSLLINQFEQISAFSAGLTRLSTFIDRIDSLSHSENNGTAPANSSYPFASRGPTIYMTQSALHSIESGSLVEDGGDRFHNRELLLDVRNLS